MTTTEWCWLHPHAEPIDIDGNRKRCPACVGNLLSRMVDDKLRKLKDGASDERPRE